MKTVTTPITGLEINSGEGSPYAALVNFYSAFNARDIRLMENNWLHSESVSMCNPLGGVKRSWDEIRKVYEKIFSGAATVYVEFYDYSIHGTRDMFVAVGRERGTLTFNNETIALSIRTSRSYQWVDRQWKQLHHHGSMDDARLLKSYQDTILNHQYEVTL